MTKKEAISIALYEIRAYAQDHLDGDDELYDNLRVAVKVLEGSQ